MLFSESNVNISASLAKAWATIQTPKHNAKVNVRTKNGGSYTFEYTDLNGILDAVKPIFVQNHLSIIQNSYTTIEGNLTMACVETIFLHESGEYVKSYPLKFQAASSMQDFGGQITYMKRYSLSAMLGLATEKDDDANGASGNEYQYMNQPSPKQKNNSGQPQQQENNQQMQHQNPPNNTGLRTQEQFNEIARLLSEVAAVYDSDPNTVYNGAMQKCKIPDKNSDILTTKEADSLIQYLRAIKMQVAQ